MTQPNPLPTPRQRYLYERQRKQNYTFAIVGIAMSVVALISILVMLNIIPIPFGNEFSRAVKYAETGDTPCPSAGAKPVDPASISVQVLNTTSRQGLASEATSMLESAGYQPLEAGNATEVYPGAVEIDAGPTAIDDAYTVARFFPDAKVVLTDSTDKTVSVLLGTFYDGALSAEETQAVINSQTALQGPNSCLPLSEEALLQRSQSAGDTSAESGE